MPVLLALAGGAIVGAYVTNKLDDAFGGAPSPFTLGGAAVWGLAGAGGYLLFRKVVR